MSGFVLVYQRDGTAVDTATFSKMMTAIEHRGFDGHDAFCCRSVALGHHHFWTTQEEVGERQPRWSAAGQYAILFDGRLDNRHELLNSLQMGDTTAHRFSDAEIVLHAYEKWSERSFARLLGPFALAIYDTVLQRVVCARDALGDRTLFYHLNSRLLLLASEEQALLAHPAVSEELDETTLALYFAVRPPTNGRTFFTDVRELLPAHILTITADRVQIECYWAVNAEKLSYRSDTEYADHFRELLDRSVQRCLRTVAVPAVLMSGGLDSTSVATLAALQLVASNKPYRLCTISWVFDKFPTCDERSYMGPLVERYNLSAIRVNGDSDWPLHDPFPLEAFNPGRPFVNPYDRLRRRAYEAAHDNGIRVLLTGGFGDDLYSGAEDWLLDLLLEQRLLEAGSEFLQAKRKFGLRPVLASRSLRRVGIWLLSYLPGMQHILTQRRKRQQSQIAWLTAYAHRQLPDLGQLFSPACARRPSQCQAVLHAYGASQVPWASRLGIEPRYPYRDRQLVEFMLAIPAHQLYRQRFKHILRNAMADFLPANILNQEQRTSLLPIYKWGLMHRAGPLLEMLQHDPAATWRRFVDPHWLESSASWAKLDNGLGSRETLLFWRSLNLELWLQARRNTDNERNTANQEFRMQRYE
jgi:asparagine synthase (glutamine-hydrolysing)